MKRPSVPRRPQGQSGPAQSAAALGKVGGFVDPQNTELLAQFLGNSHVQEDRESGIAVCLKLMNKVSETTKLKALTDLEGRVRDVDDDALSVHVPATLDCIRMHVDHDSAQLRAQLFDLLRCVVAKGRSVKQQLASTMGSLFGPWVCGMNDMESNVRTSATAAFHQCFAEDKRPIAIEKYALEAATFAVDRLKDIAQQQKKPILDDAADAKANVVYASFGALSFLMRHAPCMHKTVLGFMSSPEYQKHYAPTRPMGKNALLLRTPRARSSVLALLRDVTEVCPMDSGRHALIASAVAASIGDADVNVARRVWELLVSWTRKHPLEAINSFPKQFLDSVVDAILTCETPETTEVQLQMLLPFVATVSKDARCGPSTLDEFCGALVEKVNKLCDTPNVAATEMGVAWAALLEFWELLCLRKRDEGKQDEAGLELFAVVLFAAVRIATQPTKSKRYSKLITAQIAKSVLRAAQRDAAILPDLIAIVAHDVAKLKYSAIPLTPEEEPGQGEAGGDSVPLSQEDALHQHMQQLAAMRYVGCMISAELLNLLDDTPVAGTRGHGASDTIASVLLPNCVAAVDTAALIAFADIRRGGDVPLGPEVCKGLAQMAIELVTRVTAAEDEAPQQDILDAQKLLRASLRCANGACVGEVTDALTASTTASITPSWVKTILHESLTQNPTKLQSSLIDAILAPDVDGEVVERLAAMLLVHKQQHGLDVHGEAANVVEELRAAVAQAMDSLAASVDVRATAQQRSSNDAGDDSDEDASDGDDGSEDGASSSSSCSQHSEEADANNMGIERMTTLMAWLALLCKQSALSTLLLGSGDTDDASTARSAQPQHSFASSRVPEQLYRTAVALAPRLQVDLFTSSNLVRSALQSADAADDSADDEAMLPCVLASLDRKRHWVGTDAMQKCRDALIVLFNSHGIPAATVAAWASRCFNDALYATGSVLGACNQLDFLFLGVPASDVRELLLKTTHWDQCAIQVAPAAPRFPHYVGQFELTHMKDGMLSSAVRTAQLVKLADQHNLVDEVLASPFAARTGFVRVLLAAYACLPAFSDPVRHNLCWKQLRPLLCQLDAEGYQHLLKDLESHGQWHLVSTLGLALLRIARLSVHHSGGSMSAVTSAQDAMQALFVVLVGPPRTAELFQQLAHATCEPVMAFFEHVHQLAALEEQDVLYAIDPAHTEVLSALQMVAIASGTPTHVVVLCLALLRHTAMKTPLPDTVALSIATQTIPKRPPHEALSLLSELMCSRIANRTIYLDLPRQCTAVLSQSYALHHLPSNGRLGQRPRTSVSGGLPHAVLLPMVRAIRGILRGLRYHTATDDVLHASTHLVLFDIICEGVAQLQPSRLAAGNMEPLVALLALVGEQLHAVSTADVAPLRASQQSIGVIADAFHFVYQWLHATTVAKLDALGIENVRHIVCAISSLVHLTLVRSRVSTPTCIVEGILKKPTMKPLRKPDAFTTVEPLRLQRFRKYYDLFRKASKQKLLAQVVLLAWAVVASNESEQPFDAVDDTNRKDGLRRHTYQLCDWILALSLSPLHPVSGAGSNKGLSDTVLHAPPMDDDLLGYDLLALTRILHASNDQSMSLLARGAVSVLTLLLQSTTLPYVKEWLDTTDRRLRDALLLLIEGHISPALIHESLANVLSHSSTGETTFALDDAVTVSVQMDKRTIAVGYTMDEISVGVRISLPKAFPMRAAAVSTDNAAVSSTTKGSSSCPVQGVSNEKWRFWILKMSATLFSGSSNLWGCVRLFEENIKRHFEGVEPCPICYGVVSSVNNRLPEMRCAVCRNSLFHASCLYTWWGNSGQTSCPMCRSPWVSQ